MRRSNFALRVPPTLLAEARKAAESERVALNQLITLPLAEKASAMRTEEYFEERSRRADSTKVSTIVARVGKGTLPSRAMNFRQRLFQRRREKRTEEKGG